MIVSLPHNVKNKSSSDMEKELDLILNEFDEGNMCLNTLRAKLLLLLGVSTRTFNVGDKVQWRGMNLIVVEVGVNEILIATSENVDDENYNDWWVGTQYVC
jgi:hypothetical protein